MKADPDVENQLSRGQGGMLRTGNQDKMSLLKQLRAYWLLKTNKKRQDSKEIHDFCLSPLFLGFKI